MPHVQHHAPGAARPQTAGPAPAGSHQAKRGQPGSRPSRPRAGRGFGAAMLAEAATLWAASYLHRQGRISLGFTTIKGEHFPGASIPELVIGIVLALGALMVLAAPARARRPALIASGFGVFGILVGITILITGGSPNTAADLTYHATILAATLATFVLLIPRHPGPA